MCQITQLTLGLANDQDCDKVRERRKNGGNHGGDTSYRGK